MTRLIIFNSLMCILVACSHNANEVEDNRKSSVPDSIQQTTNVDSSAEINEDVIISNVQSNSLTEYYLLYAFNDTLRSDLELASDFLFNVGIQFDNFYDHDLEENVISFALTDAEENSAEFTFNYLDDETSEYLRFSHSFRFNNESQANSFLEFAFNDLKKRFGEDYVEGKSGNCLNYLWQYKAELLYDCSSYSNTVIIRK